MRILVIFCTLILTGCTTTKYFQPIGGSKSDATVTLAYEYGLFERPSVDWNMADATATQRCKAWGFKKADRFGTQKSCRALGGYGNCNLVRVTTNYQCI